MNATARSKITAHHLSRSVYRDGDGLVPQGTRKSYAYNDKRVCLLRVSVRTTGRESAAQGFDEAS